MVATDHTAVGTAPAPHIPRSEMPGSQANQFGVSTRTVPPEPAVTRTDDATRPSGPRSERDFMGRPLTSRLSDAPGSVASQIRAGPR
jgi:hypothetical protein